MIKITDLNDLERESKLIRGRWKLDTDHVLTYRKEMGRESFTFEASLIAAEPAALVISFTEKQEDGKAVTRLAKLLGTWQANNANQIEFEVSRQSGQNDVLIFRGGWKIGNAHQIIYRWRQKSSNKKNRKLQTLTFRGWWDLSGDDRLVYTLEGSEDGNFRFRGAFQTPGILAKKGEIRYQLGAEAGGKNKIRVITFFGKWKLSDRLELSFEMECADGRKHEMRFGAQFAAAPEFAVAARLIDKSGVPLGVEVILTKEFLRGQGAAFVRLKKTLEESALEAGVTLPW